MIAISNPSDDNYVFSGVAILANVTLKCNIDTITKLFFNDDFINNLANRNLKVLDNGRHVPYPECVEIIKWYVGTTVPDVLDSKLASVKADTSSYVATLLLKVPGTFSGNVPSSNGRMLASGELFFNSHTTGDKLLTLQSVDVDNVTGAGANAVLKNLYDDEVPQDNQGWYFPPSGVLEIRALKAIRFLPGGTYLKVTAQKAGLIEGTLYANMHWGKLLV